LIVVDPPALQLCDLMEGFMLPLSSGCLDEQEVSDRSVLGDSFMAAEIAGNSLMLVGCGNEGNRFCRVVFASGLLRTTFQSAGC
jgi:hypothetical protein